MTLQIEMEKIIGVKNRHLRLKTVQQLIPHLEVDEKASSDQFHHAEVNEMVVLLLISSLRILLKLLLDLLEGLEFFFFFW